MNQNQVKDALKTLEGLNQEDSYVLYCTGVCYARLNETAKANDYKAKAFQADPSLRQYDDAVHHGMK